MTAAVAAHGLVKRFAGQGRNVLDGLTFSVARGECVALLGPSGCGKTTLLRLLMGIESPSDGQLEIDPALLGHFSYVFQEPRLVPWRTTLENVRLPLELSTHHRDSPDTSRALLEQLGLGERLDHFPRELSGGMQMRAALARALVTNPRVLLLDEPFAALDERTRFRLQDLLLELRSRLGLQYFFVTHSIAEAVYLGDRVLLLDTRGRLSADQRIDLGPRSQDTKLSAGFTEHVRGFSDRFDVLEQALPA
jgi:NitT/TauT family transport system ATP-binding protein